MVTCAGCPYGTFGQRTGIQRSSVQPIYVMNREPWTENFGRRTRNALDMRNGGAPPVGNAAAADVSGPYATAASSSKKPRVLFGSTGMPGPMVVVKVIFFR